MWIAVGVVAAFLITFGGLGVLSWRRPAVGPIDGKLRACPKSPNCVCSQVPADAEHTIAPLTFTGAPAEAWAKLQRVLADRPGARVVSADDKYVHVEFVSRLFRFTDDVEFLLDGPAGVVHVRSASRVGHSDLGANRARVEAIRQAFQAGP